MEVENNLTGALTQVLRCFLGLTFQIQQCGEAPEPVSPAALEGQVILLLGPAEGMCVCVCVCVCAGMGGGVLYVCTWRGRRRSFPS